MSKIFQVNKRKVVWALMLPALLYLFSCVERKQLQDVSHPGATYGLFVSLANASTTTGYYLLTCDDLMKDTILNPTETGIPADFYWSTYYGAFRSGYYYMYENDKLRKMQVRDGKLAEIARTETTNDPWGLAMMKVVFTDKLNFLSWTAHYDSTRNVLEKKMYIVDPETMKVESSKPVAFPAPTWPIIDSQQDTVPLRDQNITPSSFTIRDGKVIIGYYYHWTTTNDTAYVLMCDYPSLANPKVLKDTGYGHISGLWVASSSGFTDEKGDYYLTLVDKNKNYSIRRIKKGATEIDPDYAFNLAGSGVKGITVTKLYADQDHHAYLGNGLAFVGSHILDVHQMKIVKDLNSYGLGEIQGTMESFVAEGKLYVPVKTKDNRWHVARYNPEDQLFVLGLEISGNIKQIHRISRW